MLSARPAGLPLDADRGISNKTPARALTKMRNVLQENAIRNAPSTVAGKGRKVVQSTPLQPKTLQTDRVAKDPPGKQVGPSKLRDAPAVRPLGDKTPFPNRTNRLSPTGAKVPQPALHDASLRPTSARKHDRLPRSSGKAFETPITNGKHWDVSDIEIEVDAPIVNQSIEEETYDEIEYMPPKVEDIPYEPPFEMPNYREVGKTLMALIRSYTLEDDPPSNNLTFTADASESSFFARPVLPQQEIEDDGPFAKPKPKPVPKPQPPTTLRQRSATISQPISRPTAQRTTMATRAVTPTANTRVPSVVRRPPPTSSTRPPMTAARKSVSQPVSRAPTSQSTVRAPTSRANTRAQSVARLTPPVRTGGAQPCRAPVSRPTTRPAARSTAPVAPAKGKTLGTGQQPSATSTVAKTVVPCSNAPPSAGRPRSGTITKAEFEANTHVAIHIRNNSLEDVKKDLEGLVVFEDAFDDEDDGFRFEV